MKFYRYHGIWVKLKNDNNIYRISKSVSYKDNYYRINKWNYEVPEGLEELSLDKVESDLIEFVQSYFNLKPDKVLK